MKHQNTSTAGYSYADIQTPEELTCSLDKLDQSSCALLEDRTSFLAVEGALELGDYTAMSVRRIEVSAQTGYHSLRNQLQEQHGGVAAKTWLNG